jgi:hypothetical protein
MSDALEGRRLYGSRDTLFVAGVGVGDYYQAGDGIYRVRLWPEDRLQGGRERLVLTEDAARQTLLGMFQRVARDGGE